MTDFVKEPYGISERDPHELAWDYYRLWVPHREVEATTSNLWLPDITIRRLRPQPVWVVAYVMEKGDGVMVTGTREIPMHFEPGDWVRAVWHPDPDRNEVPSVLLVHAVEVVAKLADPGISVPDWVKER
jgi:hypothetical protein